MSVNVKWILEAYVWQDKSIERFEASIKKLGLECVKISPEDARNGMKSLGEKEECVVFYGSLETAREIVRSKPWIPGVFYTPDNYRCRNYYPAFGSHLLNAENYAFYPYGDLIRMKEAIFTHFAEDRAVFIRPDEGDKTFTGKLVYKEDYEKEVDYFGFYGINPSALVVVSEPKNIYKEWRLFMSEGKVVTGSLYKIGRTVKHDPNVADEVIDFANRVAGLYTPDRVWVLDICETLAGNYYVLEIGCMSCSGIYACDTDKLVEAATNSAAKEFEEYQP
jgi:hypothetical protein